jgi:hypothetical protein
MSRSSRWRLLKGEGKRKMFIYKQRRRENEIGLISYTSRRRILKEEKRKEKQRKLMRKRKSQFIY